MPTRTHAADASTWNERVAFAGLTLGLLLLPLPLGSNRPWAVALALTWFAGVALLYLIPHLLRSGALQVHTALRGPLIVSLLWLAWLLLYLWPMGCAEVQQEAAAGVAIPTATCTWAAAPEAHWEVLLRSALYGLIGLLTLVLADRMQRAWILLGCVLAAGVGWALAGTLAALSGHTFDAGWMRIGQPQRASGPFVNPNHLAGHLVMLLGLGIGVLIGLMRETRDQRTWRQWLRDLLRLLLSPRAMLRMALVVMVVGLVATQSRSGNIAFMLALLAGLGVGAWALPRLRRRLLILGASLLLVDVLVISSAFGLDRLAARVEASARAAVAQPATAHSPSTLLLGADAERAAVAGVTFALWQQSPWVGHGGGGFRALFPELRPAHVSDRLYDHAHNDYAQWLAEYGLVGAAFALLLVGAGAWAALTALRRRQRGTLQGLALGCLIAGMGLGIHSWTDFNLQIPANAALAVVVLALAWQCRHGFPATRTTRRSQRSARSMSASWGGGVLPAVLCVALGGIGSAAQAQEPPESACESALLEPAQTIAVPPLPSISAAVARQRRDAHRDAEAPRVVAADTAMALAMRALALTATGQAQAAADLESQLRTLLHDTVWRVQQAVKAGDARGALTLLLMYRLHMTNDPVHAQACASLQRFDPSAADPIAAYELALCRLGDDRQRALQALQHAAHGGHVLAMETLGRLCLQTQPADPVCAAAWLCKAARHGHGAAAGQAAWLLQSAAAPNWPLVVSLYERGVGQADPVSQNNLAEVLELGLQGRADPLRAEALYRAAASLGLAEARLNLARLGLARPINHPDHQAARLTLQQLQDSHPEAVRKLRALAANSM